MMVRYVAEKCTPKPVGALQRWVQTLVASEER